MSNELKIERYSLRGFSGTLVPEEKGYYVRYDDYARLQAENERLTKAGDAMVKRMRRSEEHTSELQSH